MRKPVCACRLQLRADGTCPAGCHKIREERRLAREAKKKRKAEAAAELAKPINGTAVERTFKRAFADVLDREKRAGLIPTNRSQRGKR
jgi:hypothetical protein